MSQRPLRFSLVLGQRLPWPVLHANATATEAFGFDGLYLVDHFFGRLDVDEPTHEGYTMLGAIAAQTRRVRLGLMVAGNTYRNPVFLLKQAIAVDHISRGRVDFGVGAGWAEREHEAYGFELGPPKERVDRFAEALDLWRMLQTQSRTTFAGTHYQIVDAPFEPKSVQGQLPLLIGGTKPRMLRLVAEYASIWNCTAGIEDGHELNRQLDVACRNIGRDPEEIERSVSPEINMLESVDAFRNGVEQYQAVGFSHITLPWPRVDSEIQILLEVAANHLSEFRPNPPAPDPNEQQEDMASTEAGLQSYGYPRMQITDWPAARPNLKTHPHWPLLAYLIQQPNTVVPADRLREITGLESNQAVAEAFAELATVLPDQGERPWIEGPRGWSVSAEIAYALG